MGSVEEPTASGTRSGSRFGHYLLRRLLGQGGFGEVYEAEDTDMNRVVALKLIAAPYSRNPVFRERLYREARTAGRLHEPHVVPIHHCGEIDGQLFIDMRFIDGTDLHHVLAREGWLSPAKAVAIIRQVASALDSAHADQVIHRDVKPANILLTGDDFAYLVDFGIANAATDAKLTSSGITIGTFAYMAPERFGGGDVGHRADIYSLACVLYECLTGVPPYPRPDLPALMNAHLTAPIPRPSQRRRDVPAAFDLVIARGLAKAANDRYSSAGALARAAQDALTAPDRNRAEKIIANTQAAPVRGVVQRPKPPSSRPPAEPQQTRGLKGFVQAWNSVPRQTRRWAVIGITVGLLVLLTCLAIGRTVIRSNYYVTAYNGDVSIMRGVQGSILGYRLHEPYLVGCLNSHNELSQISYGQPRGSLNCRPMKLSDLRPADRAQIAAGMPGGSLEETIAQLHQLTADSLLPPCPPPRATSPDDWQQPPTRTTVTALPPPPPEPGTDCRAVA